MSKIYKTFLIKYTNINWLINHKIDFKGSNDDYNLYQLLKIIGYTDSTVYNIVIKPQVNSLNYNEILIDSIFNTYLLSQCNYNESNTNLSEKNVNDKNRFGNKNYKTIIFTSNFDTYYEFEWTNNDINLIIQNKNFIINLLKEKLCEHYSVISKNIYKYYKYYKNLYTSQKLSSEKIIKNIIQHIKKINESYESKKDKLPDFIIKYFEKINIILSITNKAKRESILNSYDNEEYFMEELNNIIIESINTFLGIETEIDTETDIDADTNNITNACDE